MTAIVTNERRETRSAEPPAPYGRPDVSVLQDRVPEWLKAPRAAAGWTALIGGAFLLLSYVDVWHTDVWGHLSYGRWIQQTGSVPETEPLMPLAQGVPFIDVAWLSQWLGYHAYDRWGVAALQLLFAASVSLTAALLAVSLRRRTGSMLAAALGIAAFAWINWRPLMIVRPQLAGLVCFTMLLVWLTSTRWRRWYWAAVPALFAFWANLHGSFPVGLLLIAALGAGRWIDVLWRTRRIGCALKDRTFLRLLLLLQLAAAAVLLNPYGLGVYAEVLTFSRNPNLADLTEWDPLNVRMQHGQAAAAVAVLLCVFYRFTQRRVRSAELLLLVGIGAMALWHSRMLVWWGVVAAYYLSLHGGAIWRRMRHGQHSSSPRSGKWSVVTAGMAWICFAYTPFGLTLLHGRPADPEQAEAQFRRSVSDQTPIDAVKYLVEKQPRGQMFNTYEWGDYLLWAGPSDVQVFAASHAHLIPEEVWDDYMRIAYASDDWKGGLDRYGVNTVLIDHRWRASLIRRMKSDPDWEVGYEDSTAVVFLRKRPI